MNIENHVVNSKKAIDYGQAKLNAGDFDSAIRLFSSAYSDVRQLMEHAQRMKRKAVLAKYPARETDKDLREKHQWLQSQGGISSEGFVGGP